ncbi:CPBP family intramembrane glutamic endopeptidase [Arcobacter sp. YIC-464]|uniref:CPBP family intramembrane glutamic endopeptidase n=1 Tax=Arcobacter sp. YIC-464 TaxID=3376631 RepID=UPI003C248529
MLLIRLKKNKEYLLFEFTVLFLLIPFILFMYTPTPILPYLWIIAGFCTFILLKDKKFNKENFFRQKLLSKNIKALILEFFIISLFIVSFMFYFLPELFFSLFKQNPYLWLAVIILYPLLSVYPQEVVYRAYFFHRYKKLFSSKANMILINAFLFGYMHIIFHNYIAVILTIGGGYLFARLYDKTHSLAVLFVAHSLYGCMLFTIGLGEFFYTGTIATMQETFKF